jgi:hypothetical protein
MAGTTTETCIRVFVQLEAAGWIATHGGQLIIKNIDQAYANGWSPFDPPEPHRTPDRPSIGTSYQHKEITII